MYKCKKCNIYTLGRTCPKCKDKTEKIFVRYKHEKKLEDKNNKNN